MSRWIKVTCPGCALDINVAPADFRLWVCENDEALSTYQFPCPTCGLQAKHANDTVTAGLIQEGIQAATWRLPAGTTPDELTAELEALCTAAALIPTQHVPAEALELHSGPPLSYDDLLDLHQELEQLGRTR